MNIGREIACGEQPFLIAEAGLNHCGNVALAENMIWIAKSAGCDAIKYQTYDTRLFCRPEDPMYETFERCQLPRESWSRLKRVCDQAQIVFLSTPQNPSDLDILLDVGIPAIKIGSDDLTNLTMLKYCAKQDLPLILSTGMSGIEDVSQAWYIVGEGAAFLCCTSQYPTPMSEVNARRIKSFRGTYPQNPIGFSDHTVGNTASVIATALGACIIEKHFTLDHNFPGPDHKWSMDPAELRSWVKAVREAHEMMGDGIIAPSVKELEQKRKYQRTSCGLRGVA